VSSDVSEPKHDPEGSSPEAVLEFLSQHRQGTERGTTRDRRKRRRRGQTALLAVVAAVVIAGAGVVIWRSVGSNGTSSTAHVGAPGQTTGVPGKSSTRTTTGSGVSRTTAAPKKHQTERPSPAAKRGTEPWNRTLFAWRHAPGRGLPDFYYQWLHAGSSCAPTASYSCWKLKVATRHGCPRGVMMILEETRDGADVGPSWGFSRPLAARVSGVVEVDADQSGVGARVDSMLCRTSQAAG